MQYESGDLYQFRIDRILSNEDNQILVNLYFHQINKSKTNKICAGL